MDEPGPGGCIPRPQFFSSSTAAWAGPAAARPWSGRDGRRDSPPRARSRSEQSEQRNSHEELLHVGCARRGQQVGADGRSQTDLHEEPRDGRSDARECTLPFHGFLFSGAASPRCLKTPIEKGQCAGRIVKPVASIIFCFTAASAACSRSPTSFACMWVPSERLIPRFWP